MSLLVLTLPGRLVGVHDRSPQDVPAAQGADQSPRDSGEPPCTTRLGTTVAPRGGRVIEFGLTASNVVGVPSGAARIADGRSGIRPWPSGPVRAPLRMEPCLLREGAPRPSGHRQ